VRAIFCLGFTDICIPCGAGHRPGGNADMPSH